MASIRRKVLEQVIAGVTEPLLLLRVDQPDWPLTLANDAFFSAIGKSARVGQPFADIMETIAGRDFALEVSEAVRSGQDSSLPVEVQGREYMLVLRPLDVNGSEAAEFVVAYWRSAAGDGSAESAEMRHALLKAKRRIRNLSRDDSVTGLMNGRAFREVFEHDWAVATREQSRLCIVTFDLDDFDAYVEVFGRHAADSCLRRVGQAIRRCLRRASDVVARPADGARYVVLSHASDEAGIREFAARIARSVRELGLHHPRASESRFVTVRHTVHVVNAAKEKESAGEWLDSLLGSTSGD